ncbi:OmpA family protein [Falsiroseomonas sp. E2-1-a4]|uniref:OmpA family protein n=1 Tax=Falsiroseomonas sp. E2-1-a4 TaxID=3239299 RepID=UPI003F3FE4FF
MIRRALIPTLIVLLALPAAAEQGLSARAEGGWRLAFEAGQSSLPAATRDAIAGLAPGLAALPQGRITVEAQASSPADDASLARRLSLARAGAVRDVLVAAGLPATRIDIRALGRRDPPADIAEILPPGVKRADAGPAPSSTR